MYQQERHTSQRWRTGAQDDEAHIPAGEVPCEETVTQFLSPREVELFNLKDDTDSTKRRAVAAADRN